MKKSQFYKEIFKDHPQLFSKRGFETNRIRMIMPKNVNELAYITDKSGNKLNINL